MSVSTCQSSALSAMERQYILLTQNGIPIVPKPYNWLAEQLELPVDEVLDMTNDLLERGVIRRIAAVPNHYKLGYRFNGMTVWDIDDEKITEYGNLIGKLPFVSHCYRRPRRLPQWNYNLFAMVHGQTPEEISQYRQQIKTLLEDVLVSRDSNTKSCDMLTSTQILKKTGLRLKNNTSRKDKE